MGLLTNHTGAEISDLFFEDKRFEYLTDTQKLSNLNFAKEKVIEFLNSIDKPDFLFDTIGDADLVLAPTGSSYGNLYDGYMHIKFGAYDGTIGVIAEVTAMTIGFDTLGAGDKAIDISGTPCIYTLSFGGESMDEDTIVHPGEDTEASLEKIGGDELTITVIKSHSAFSIFVKNAKES